ncbi:hypothetical protein FB45DRAFT_1046703 [Roridomyces roridus]|uniref:DNA breaking-rejoining enzyme n=1 Tax=Roridomyces roridus TaxID=1738132 RepID=A0AAD7AXE0_9AGAR|nr:hypothetical protein FB45DRAFT_1046703 [Roridomyces roridus]
MTSLRQLVYLSIWRLGSSSICLTHKSTTLVALTVAGLLHFTQFCNRLRIPERDRMPASRALLSGFVAEAAGTCTGKCIRNWLNGLRAWHKLNGAVWNGNDTWISSLKISADKKGMRFKRPPRGPITPAHLRVLRAVLDISSPMGAAVWSVTLAAYGGCRRLGELLLKTLSGFSTTHDTTRETRITFNAVNGRLTCGIKLVWTKTTTIVGGECILTQIIGVDSDLCPVQAFRNHLRVNHTPPPDTPLFAFRTPKGWRYLTKDTFITTSSAAYRAAGLDLVFGHSYRIGGSLALLSAGVAPEIIMKLGGWSSLCFLLYWRRLQEVIPMAISRAWDERIREFAKTHGHPPDISSLSLDD